MKLVSFVRAGRAGFGAQCTPPLFLRAGDVAEVQVQVEVDAVGVLRDSDLAESLG